MRGLSISGSRVVPEPLTRAPSRSQVNVLFYLWNKKRVQSRGQQMTRKIHAGSQKLVGWDAKPEEIKLSTDLHKSNLTTASLKHTTHIIYPSEIHQNEGNFRDNSAVPYQTCPSQTLFTAAVGRYALLARHIWDRLVRRPCRVKVACQKCHEFPPVVLNHQ